MAAQHRLARLMQRLGEQGIDTVVGVSAALHNFLEGDPVLALSGFRPMGPSAVLACRSGEAVLLVSPAWDAERARRQCKAWRVLDCDDLASALERLLMDMALPDAPVGLVAADTVPKATMDRVRAALGERQVPARAELNQATAVHTADEIQDARTATELAEQAYGWLQTTVRPGMREFEVAAELLCHLKALGSPDNFLLMSASQHNQAVRPPGRRVLERGDILLAEITPMYNNQFTQICRSLVLGPVAPAMQARYDLQVRAMEAGRRAALPGAPVAAVADAINACMAEAGLKDYCRPPYMRVRGHGLGSVTAVPTDVDSQNTLALQPGMVFVTHPNQYFPDVGYLLCGEPVVIEEGLEGARLLSAGISPLGSLAC